MGITVAFTSVMGRFFYTTTQKEISMNESLKTNDQVNRDAASGVPTPNPANTAAPVQRMVRCNLRLGFKLLDECRFDCVVWENTPITGAWWHCRLSENASKQFGMSLKHQIEIGSCSLEDVREIQSYFDEGFLHSGFVLGASSHLDLSEHCQPEVQIWSEGIVKPASPVSDHLNQNLGQGILNVPSHQPACCFSLHQCQSDQENLAKFQAVPEEIHNHQSR